jgi:hypothetical protein
VGTPADLSFACANQLKGISTMTNDLQVHVTDPGGLEPTADTLSRKQLVVSAITHLDCLLTDAAARCP